MRLFSAILLLGVLISAVACGGGHSTNNNSQAPLVSGNWRVTLSGTSSSQVFTGFLVQSGGSVTGSFLQALLSNCSGIGSVTGTVNGQDVSLTIDQLGDSITLTGTTVNPGAPMSGNFTAQSGLCTPSSSGSWSAVQIPPIGGGSAGGNFHGSFTSQAGNGIVNVTGTLVQGPNTGHSTATLSGTLARPGGAFCSYVLPGTITGLISGTGVQLNLYGQNGLQYAQLGSFTNGGATLSPDGTSISGTYGFPQISNSCPADQGSFNLLFP